MCCHVRAVQDLHKSQYARVAILQTLTASMLISHTCIISNVMRNALMAIMLTKITIARLATGNVAPVQTIILV